MLSKNVVSSVITQIPIFLLGIISGVFTTRILGDEAKGAFALFQANYLLFLLVFSFSIQISIVYFISSKKFSEKLVIDIAFTLFFFCSSLVLLLLLLSHQFNFNNLLLPEKYITQKYAVALFLFFFLSFLHLLITSFFQARSQFKLINRISILNSFINALYFPLLFLYVENSALSTVEKFDYVLLSSLLILCINTVIWLYFYFVQFAIIPTFSNEIFSRLKEFLTYSFLIYIGMFVNFFNYRLDLWVVNHYLDEKQLSYYSLSANIVQIILYISVTIASVIFPYLSNSDEESRMKIFVRISRFSFVFFLLIILIAFITSPYIIPFMYGEEFYGTVIPFQILSFGILFSCLSQLLSILMVSSNKNIYNIIACSVGLIFTVCFDVLLIPKLEIIGAAIATLISYVSIFTITYIFVLKKTTIGTKNLFIPTRDDIKSLQDFILNKKSR